MHMMKVVQRPRENGKKRRLIVFLDYCQKIRDKNSASCGKSSKLIRLRKQNMPIFSIISSLILLNDASGGKSWEEHGVHRSQVYKRNERIPETSEIIWEQMKEIIQKHIEQGHLFED